MYAQQRSCTHNVGWKGDTLAHIEYVRPMYVANVSPSAKNVDKMRPRQCGVPWHSVDVAHTVVRHCDGDSWTGAGMRKDMGKCKGVVGDPRVRGKGPPAYKQCSEAYI